MSESGVCFELLSVAPDRDSEIEAEPVVRARFIWPLLVATACLMAVLWSTGPRQPALLESSTPPTVQRRDEPDIAIAVDRTLVVPGEIVTSPDPLVVLGATSPELSFFPGALGDEDELFAMDDVEAATILATGNRLEQLLEEAAGSTVVVEKVSLLGRHEGRLLSIIWYRTGADADNQCVGLRDNDRLISSTCQPLAPVVLDGYLPAQPTEAATFYDADTGELHIISLPPEVAVVSILTDTTHSWQRPVGGVSVFSVELLEGQELNVRYFDADGKEISTGLVTG